MSLRSTLATFEHQLVAARHPVAQYWNAGLEEDQARDLLTAVGVAPAPELLALYTWKNGQSYEGVPTGKLIFGARGVLFPLEVALQEYALSQQEHFYEPHFFPLFHADELLLNLNAQSPHYGRIYLYAPSLIILTPELIYDSLEAMFDTFAACFGQGIYGYDAHGYFDYNQDAEWALSQALNPHATYWKAAEIGNGNGPN